MSEHYFIVNERGKALSRFLSGDCKTQLHFLRTEAMSFPTIEEAERQINYIQSRANQKTQPAALRLRVSMNADGWNSYHAPRWRPYIQQGWTQ